jgi:hypothetical protein
MRFPEEPSEFHEALDENIQTHAFLQNLGLTRQQAHAEVTVSNSEVEKFRCAEYKWRVPVAR